MEYVIIIIIIIINQLSSLCRVFTNTCI